MECALKHVETQMDNLLLAMGDDPLSPEVAIACLCSVFVCSYVKYLCGQRIEGTPEGRAFQKLHMLL